MNNVKWLKLAVGLTLGLVSQAQANATQSNPPETLSLAQAKTELTNGNVVNTKWIIMPNSIEQVTVITYNCGPLLPSVPPTQLDSIIANHLMPTLIGKKVDFPTHLTCHYKGFVPAPSFVGKATTEVKYSIDNPRLAPCPLHLASKPLCLYYNSAMKTRTDFHQGNYTFHAEAQSKAKNHPSALELFKAE